MYKAIMISVFSMLVVNLFAQSTIDNVLLEVEKNNTTLLAMRKHFDAEKIGNKTGLAPQNPEVEFNYLWGNSSEIGNRTDFSIKQSFDFPTVYAYKNQISNLKNQQVELEYQKQLNEILYQTRVLCVSLTYTTALNVELGKRQSEAMKVAEAYKAKFNAGDIGVLEFNKAQVNYLNVSKHYESNVAELNGLLSQLTAFNGGMAINFDDNLFPILAVNADFEQWYAQAEANNALLQWVKYEIAISEKQEKLNTAVSLPKFYGGYMSEKVVGQQFQGVTVGVAIPLWENKNTVKFAKAKTTAMQSFETDSKLQFYNSMKMTHAKVVALQNTVNDYRNQLSMFNNSHLLEKAFNKGEISLPEYMFELSLYYDGVFQLLEMEKQLHLAFAELNRFQ